LSKSRKKIESMLPSEEAGERFMAVMLWAQSSSCTCQACQYFREMAANLIRKHIKEAEKRG